MNRPRYFVYAFVAFLVHFLLVGVAFCRRSTHVPLDKCVSLIRNKKCTLLSVALSAACCAQIHSLLSSSPTAPFSHPFTRRSLTKGSSHLVTLKVQIEMTSTIQIESARECPHYLGKKFHLSGSNPRVKLLHLSRSTHLHSLQQLANDYCLSLTQIHLLSSSPVSVSMSRTRSFWDALPMLMQLKRCSS